MEDIKYAVYSVGSDGKDVLSVAVDSHDDAKRELEKLSKSSDLTCIKIKKCKVENFGKEGERIIESEEVECWNKPIEQKLSSLHQVSGNGAPAAIQPAATTAATQSTDSNNNGQAMSAGGAVNEKEKELINFLNHYAEAGDLMGLGYGFFKSNKNENGSAPPVSTPIDSNHNSGGTPTPKPMFEVEGNEIKIKKDRLIKLKDELESLTKEINAIEQAQMAQVVNNPAAASAPKNNNESDDGNDDNDDDDEKDADN